MSRASLRAFMNATGPDPDRETLLAAGFEWSPRFAGCWLRKTDRGDYVVFLPCDTRSGKYEAHFQNRLRVDFPPTTARGVVRQMAKHEATP